MEYIYTDNPIEMAAKATAKELTKHIENNEKVLWLLSGGSSIQIAVSASKMLAGLDLSKLFVSLTDERYGGVGHESENWQQLVDGGLSLPGANLYRPLIGESVEKTVLEFNNWLDINMKNSDYRLGIFGIGTDGHTAGIKPNSTATRSSELVSSFKGDDFERVTISFNAIKKLDEAIIQVSGKDKKAVLGEVINHSKPITDQPAQILKQVPNATIYSNNHEEEL